MQSQSSFIVEDLPKGFEAEKLDKFLSENKIKHSKVEISQENDKSTAKIYYDEADIDIATLDELDGKAIDETAKFKVSFKKVDNAKDTSKLGLSNKFVKEDDPILYNMKYEEHCGSHFIQAPGDENLKFIELGTIEKQRGVIKHLLSKLGANLLSGSGIMNISLPINIFDERSLLEVFAHQCRLAPYFLDKAALADNPIDKLKYSTAYVVSRLHLSVTQLKPFNPIWGETFQCKIGDSHMYLEQSSHHPAIYHFYHLGKNYKQYGHQEPQAATGANSVSSKTKGIHYIEYSDGTIHKVFPCSILIGGTLVGDRTFAFTDKFYILDEKNDYLVYVEFNPDERGSISKFFSKKKTFPDFFKGAITRLSQCTLKDGQYTPNKNSVSFASIKGEWSKNCYIDDELLWDYNEFKPYDLLRTNYTLQSDSTFREDLALLKNGDEESASIAKTNLEEIQRGDRKLRAKYGKASH